MEILCSDLNVWLDFVATHNLTLPFLLPYVFITDGVVAREEILSPPDLLDQLIAAGLVLVSLTNEEKDCSDDIFSRYKGISSADSRLLAIAKMRSIPVLTGDRKMREVAKSEGVQVFGTLWVLDSLLNSLLIDDSTFYKCIEYLLNDPSRRLPKDELRKRLARSARSERS